MSKRATQSDLEQNESWEGWEILESITDGFFLLDASLVVTYLNEETARLWGMPREAATGQPLVAVFPEAREYALEEQFREALRTRQKVVLEFCFPGGPEGNWYEIRGYPRKGGLAVFFWRTPERKGMERKLREGHQHYQTLFSEALNPILVVDESGRYIDANSAALRFLECGRSELLGRRVWEFSPPGMADQHRREHRPFMARRTLETQYWVNGRVKTLLLNVIPLETEGGRVLYGIGHDITERKEQDEALRNSEARYRLLFDLSGMLISVYDRDGVCRLMNRSVADRFGGTPEEFQGRSFRTLHPESGEKYIRRIQEVIDTGETREYEDVVHFPAGSRWLQTRVHPLPDPHGDAPLAQIISQDVTERKRAEGALRESERQKKLILETISEAVIYLGREQRVVWANRAAAESVNRDPEGLIGKRCHEIWHDRDAFCPGCPAAESFADKKPREVERQTPDGRHWLIRTFPVLDAAETVAAMVLFGRDISGWKRAEAERQRREEQFRRTQRLESIGQLAGGVAHELNNMLSPILGHAELLEETLAEDNSALESAREIVAAGRRARDLVGQLLAFGRKQSLRFCPINLNALVRDMASLIRHALREDIDLQWHLSPSLPTISGDVGQLEQVVINLAVNARDAMPDGGTLTLETRLVTLEREDLPDAEELAPGSYVRFAVEDTGVGMELAAQERLFEPFFTTKEFGEGTGLGLATVYGTLKQHGGHVRVFSQPGQGTRFTLFFPVREESAGIECAGSESSTVPTTDPMETILVVEDEEAVRNLARTVLTREGYTVLTAANGSDALFRLSGHAGPLDLLVTDVVMPRMTGAALSEQVRERHPEARVLFMSGYEDDVLARHGISPVSVHFFQKPFSVKALVRKVRETLSEGR